MNPTVLFRFAMVTACGLCLAGCDSKAKKENENLRREVEAMRSELSARTQQANSKERAKLVEAYNVCKESYDEVGLYRSRNSKRKSFSTTDTEWAEFNSGQKRKLSNILAEIDPNSKNTNIANAMREFLNETLPAYANANFDAFSTLNRCLDYKLNGQAELEKTASDTLAAEQKVLDTKAAALKSLVATQIEGPIKQMGMTIDPFFTNPFTGR